MIESDLVREFALASDELIGDATNGIGTEVKVLADPGERERRRILFVPSPDPPSSAAGDLPTTGGPTLFGQDAMPARIADRVLQHRHE